MIRWGVVGHLEAAVAAVAPLKASGAGAGALAAGGADAAPQSSSSSSSPPSSSTTLAGSPPSSLAAPAATMASGAGEPPAPAASAATPREAMMASLRTFRLGDLAAKRPLHSVLDLEALPPLCGSEGASTAEVAEDGALRGALVDEYDRRRGVGEDILLLTEYCRAAGAAALRNQASAAGGASKVDSSDRITSGARTDPLGTNVARLAIRAGGAGAPCTDILLIIGRPEDQERLARDHVRKSLFYHGSFLGNGVLSTTDNGLWRTLRPHLAPSFLPQTHLEAAFPVTARRAVAAVVERVGAAGSALGTAARTGTPVDINEFFLHEAMAQLHLTMLGEDAEWQETHNRRLRRAFQLLTGGFGVPGVPADAVREAAEYVRWNSKTLLARAEARAAMPAEEQRAQQQQQQQQQARQHAGPSPAAGPAIRQRAQAAERPVSHSASASALVGHGGGGASSSASASGSKAAAPAATMIGGCPVRPASGEGGALGRSVRDLPLACVEGLSAAKQADVQLATMTTFTFAGHDTTGNLMTWLTLEMARHPEYQARLHKEIDALAAKLDGRLLEYSDLAELPQLSAMIRETLRLWPSVPMGTYRELEHAEELLVTGADGQERLVHCPAGTQVQLPPWLLHHNTDLWGPTALEFDPDRDWLPSECWGGQAFTAQRVSSHRFAPFTYAARDCAGRNFAMAEARAILFYFFLSYDVELPPEAAKLITEREAAGIHPIYPISNFGTMAPKGGLHVLVKPRR